jgi:hypothetical protein
MSDVERREIETREIEMMLFTRERVISLVGNAKAGEGGIGF